MTIIKYGLLIAFAGNIGDDIQSLASKQFLSKVDFYLDRDNLQLFRTNKKIKVIMNGWFTHNPEHWPPPPSIHPLFLGFHITPVAAPYLLSRESIEYLKKYEPIGCRDLYTMRLLKSRGVDAYFSGCLTLTLKRNSGPPRDGIVIVDLNKKAFNALPKDIVNTSMILTHVPPLPIRKMEGYVRNMHRRGVRSLLIERIVRDLKLNTAKKVLNIYSRAELVITSRLHVVLPCIAFNTPHIFVHNNLLDPRFEGYLKYINAYSVDEFISRLEEKSDIYKLIKKNDNHIEELKNNMIDRIRKFIWDD